MNRKINLKAVFSGLLVVFIFASPSLARHVPGRAIVKFKRGVVKMPRGISAAAPRAASISAASIKSLAAKQGVFKIEQLYKKALENRPDWTHLADDYVVYFPEDRDALKVVQEYQADPNVVSAAPCTMVRAFDTIPNDTFFNNQYGLVNIRAPQAWDRITGSPAVVVAVLDTGVDASHEDFAGRIDSRGYDFVNEDNDPTDDDGHGTAVAGIIGAATNNGLGIAGVDWQAKILPLKVLNENGEGIIDDILQGIAYANSLSVEVISMSFGQYNAGLDKYSEENPARLKDRCQDAYDNNIVLMAAAGNGNVDWNSYPAYYDTVIAVAAVDENDLRSIWSGFDPSTNKIQASNFGSWVDVAAPGTNIRSTKMGGGYALYNGTSMSCPFVAGLAGLIKAVGPNLTNQEVMDIISNTTDNIDALNPGYEGKLGSGRINAYRAVSGTVAEISSPADGAYVKGAIDIYGSAGGWGFSNYILEVLQGGIPVVTLKNSSLEVENDLLGSWQTSGYSGPYTLRLRVITTGSVTEEAALDVIVDNISPEAGIVSLQEGITIEGEVTIFGTARDEHFDRYILEYGIGAAPANYERITMVYAPVDGDILGTWETSGLDGSYTVRLTAYDKAGSTASSSIGIFVRTSIPALKEASPQPGLPLTYALPNPFNRREVSAVTLNYTLAGNFDAKIYIFDLSGSLIWQQSYLAGSNGGKSGQNNPVWDGTTISGTGVANGVYLYQIIADRKLVATGKIIVLN